MPKLYIEAVKKFNEEGKLIRVGQMPTKATKYSAGLDLRANLKMVMLHIAPGNTVIIDLGIKVQPEEGYHVDLLPRSGLAVKGLTLGNCVGLIDRDYTKELKAIIHNHGNDDVYIEDNERICQLVLVKTIPVELINVESLPSIDSERTGGLGSTGRK